MPTLIIARHTARVGLATFFVLAGMNKALSPGETMAMIKSGGLAPVTIVYVATILFELGAGLLLALGGRRSAPAAIALALFCIATNLVFHRFWALDGPVAQLELSLFFKNMAIAAALIYVAQTEWTAIGRVADGRPGPRPSD